MKTTIKLFCIIAIFLISFLNAFSTPLSGTYTVGNGGDYATINSAYNDAFTQGISGPVIFSIFTGIYNEHIATFPIPGSSLTNTLTFKSQSGNSADVLITSTGFDFTVYTPNSIFKGLSIDISASNFVDIEGVNISFTNNNFNNKTIIIREYAIASDIYITGNINIGIMEFSGSDVGFINSIGPLYISNNSINGYIQLFACIANFEKNTINGYLSGDYFDGIISKNNINGVLRLDGGDIYNNFIIGEVFLYWDVNIFIYNTVVSGSLAYPALASNSLNTYYANNIIINTSGGTAFYFIRSNITSDYNDFYNGGNNGLIKKLGASYNNVTDYSNATGLDQHSNSEQVYFQSPTNLHLAGTSIGDNQLAGTPITLIPDDIDGNIRSLTKPYKGADEADFPLPVELTSFSSSVYENNVRLNWITSSELNNSGFDLERSNLNTQWSVVKFIKGHGNSNSPQSYSYTDKNLSPGKYNYRLKQIDFNGNFEYYNLLNEVEIGFPEKFSLSQNYPNPFNPSTVISYNLKAGSNVSLKVYDLKGMEVTSLISEYKEAGSYEIKFDGSNLSSGVYFYKLVAGNFSEIKRMTLVK